MGVMDKLLSLEWVFFRGGFSSLHTFHTMHYVHELDGIDHPFLALFMRATVFCVRTVSELCRSADIAFEEDAIRAPMDVPLDCGLELKELLSKLNAAEQSLSEKAKAGDEEAMGWKLRLALRRALVELWAHASDKPTKLDGLQKLAHVVVTTVGKLSGKWQPDQCPAAAVESRIVSRDLGLVHPARATPELDGPQTEADIRSTMADLDAACGVREWDHPTLEDLHSFLMLFTLRRPCIVSRACLRRWLSTGSTMLGGQPTLDVVDSVLTLYKCPPAYLKHTATIKNEFREAVGVILTHVFQVMCMNGTRQRRRIRGLLREGGPMVQVALELDTAVTAEAARRKFYRFFTAFHQLVNALMSVQLLRLGSMIALYEVDELESVYWYIHYIHHDLDLWKTEVDAARQRTDDKKGGKKAATPAPKAKIITYHDLGRTAEASFSKGVYYTMLALTAAGTFVPPTYEMQPARVRWQLRFNSLNISAPPLVPYERFQEARAVDLKLDVKALFGKAVEFYGVARAKVEAYLTSRGKSVKDSEVAFLKSLAKAAVTNTLHCQSTLGKLNKGEPAPKSLSVDWNVSPFYPCLKF